MAAKAAASEAANGIPIAIRCDNSPDLDRVPSDLSDFCLYGGLYRHVNLVYLPALALDAVHILPTLAADGSATISVKTRLYNPSNRTSPCTLAIEVTDPSGHPIHAASQTLPPWNGLAELAAFAIPTPDLWSPETPHLYRCRVTLTTAAGHTQLDERFGIRHTEFVEHGPFKLNGKRVLLRGTHRHADHAGSPPQCPTTSSARRCASSARWAQTSSASPTTSRTASSSTSATS